jgi:hypothetical protein
MVLRYLFALVSLLTCSSISARAQSIEPVDINTTGGFATSGSQEFEYAIGQLIPSTIQSPHTPGALQPAWAVVGVDELSTANLRVQVYPDPMETVLYLQPDFDLPGTLQYTLLDAAGKIVFSRNVRLNQGHEKQEINVSGLATGNYLLEVTGVQGQTKPVKSSFKLQKLR